MNQLNFGCGTDILPGWFNVDKLDYGQSHTDVIDILEGWPFEDDFFDVIMANHVMHMFSYEEYPIVLKELIRTLKPKGRIVINDFDPIKAFEAYKRADNKALIIPDEVEPTLDGKFNAYMTWYSTRKSIFTGRGIAEMLAKAGCSNSTWAEPFPDDRRVKESIQAVGVK